MDAMRHAVTALLGWGPSRGPPFRGQLKLRGSSPWGQARVETYVERGKRPLPTTLNFLQREHESQEQIATHELAVSVGSSIKRAVPATPRHDGFERGTGSVAKGAFGAKKNRCELRRTDLAWQDSLPLVRDHLDLRAGAQGLELNDFVLTPDRHERASCLGKPHQLRLEAID